MVTRQLKIMRSVCLVQVRGRRLELRADQTKECCNCDGRLSLRDGSLGAHDRYKYLFGN